MAWPQRTSPGTGKGEDDEGGWVSVRTGWGNGGSFGGIYTKALILGFYYLLKRGFDDARFFYGAEKGIKLGGSRYLGRYTSISHLGPAQLLGRTFQG